VSTDNDKKNDQVGGDWDTALEEWDESPLVPALADDKTPAPPGTSSTPATSEAASATPTVRPPEAPLPYDSEDEDDECTVVGEIPPELLADSVRGLGSASGLGQIFGRGSQPTIPADDEAEPEGAEVDFEDDSQVFTSAPTVGGRKGPDTKPPSRPEVIREEVVDGDMFDPFADLRDEIEPSPKPKAARPQPPPAPTFSKAEEPPAPSADATPVPDADSTPLPGDEASSFPVPSLEIDEISAEGPKLLEPGERHYDQDEVTEVFASDEAVDKLVARGAATAVEPAKIEADPGVPRSVAPPPPTPAKPQWPDERDAVAHLLERDQRSAWESRAAWLAEEAASRQDDTERARIMLAVSEMCAMLGDDEKGVAVAQAVRELDGDNPLAHRQARYAMVRERRWFDVLGELDAEARTAPTPEAKVHAVLMTAQLVERLNNDQERSAKLLDLASRILPSDPRPYVSKLVRRLNDEEGKSPDVRWPDEPAIAPLAKGASVVAKLRKASDGVAGPDEEISEYEAIPRAKAALRAFDTTAAARALRALESVRGMGGGATWLAASLAGQRAESRAQSMDWFDKLGAGPHAAVAQRLMALRAVESNDVEAMTKATSVPGATTFSPADRVALAALFHKDPAAADSFVAMLLGEEKTAALGAAARAALTPVSSQSARQRIEAACSIGGPAARAMLALARGIAADASRSDITERVEALRDARPDSRVGRLLDVDNAIAAGAPGKLIEQLSAWGDGGDGSAERDRALAAGLVAELLGDKERAQAEYERAIRLDPTHEGSLRSLGALDRAGHVERLVELAGQTGDDSRGAILALEAALRVGPAEAEEYLTLLRRAQELDPSLPFSAVLGERLARSRGDVDGVLDWLRTRRESSEDSVAAAYDACREAMLMVERDASFAATLVEQATRARPSDFALRALYERFVEGRPEDWVAWRVERAEEAEGVEKARLLLEAALECERRGLVDDAAKLAQAASEHGAGQLAGQCLARCELAGASTSALTDQLMAKVREDDLPAELRREVHERLAELDELGRRDLASALLWHRSILEESPRHLPSLRRIEHAYVGSGRDDDLEPIASELVHALEGPEVDGHAVVASRIRLRESSWADLAELCKVAAAQPNPSLWSLRKMFAHARIGGDDVAIAQTAKLLSQRCDTEIESATLLVQAAQALARLGENDEASQLLQMALEREPNFVQAHLDLVDVLERTGEHARAAEELETLARKSGVEEHRVELWYRGARIWLDHVKDAARGRRALEEASDINVAYEDVFEKLRAIYTDAGDATELAGLLERRLEAITDPEERVEMEVLRGRALADVGEVGGAKQALAAALDARPDHVPALEAFADVCAKEEDWSGAEQAYIRLARLVPDTERQAAIYRQLGTIYIEYIPDFERAEAALREVLKRDADDVEAQARLVDVFRETGDAEKAIELCSTLLEQAQTPEDKRVRTIQLALIHEQVEGDVKKAQGMLERIHKQAPSAVVSLRALAQFHQRQGNDAALEKLLERASTDAGRALRTGRFNRDLFSVLETVASLKGDEAGAEVSRAAIAALEGDESKPLISVGANACSVDLDDVIAPPLMDASLRALLKRVGSVLDEAFPMDLKSVRATSLPPTSGDLEHAVVSVAAAIGLQGLEVLVSPALGPTCVPIKSNPPTIVLGSALVTTEETAVRDFLLLRALKIVQTRGCVLSRTAPIDLLPLVAAMIKTFAPSFEPSGVDARRFSESMQKLSAFKPATSDPDTAALALEFAGGLDNRASTLNVAVNGWGDRAALLAQGYLTVALQAIAWAGGHPSGPPAGGRERLTWIGRNAEARDLIVFVASDSYGEARNRLGQ